MQWSNMAAVTLGAVGEPIAFSRNGDLVIELSGIYRTSQQLKRSKNKSLRLIDCDVVTVPYSDLIHPGDTVKIGLATHKVAGNPKRDSSGGMVVMLEADNIKKTNAGVFNR